MPGTTLDQQTLDRLRTWIGRREQVDDLIVPSRVAALGATLDRDDPPPQAGDPLPPLWHWTLCVSSVRQSMIGADGHPQRGGFLPPVPLPRRMWAGGRLAFRQPLRVGESVQRRSQVMSVEHKSGRSGELVFSAPMCLCASKKKPGRIHPGQSSVSASHAFSSWRGAR